MSSQSEDANSNPADPIEGTDNTRIDMSNPTKTDRPKTEEPNHSAKHAFAGCIPQLISLEVLQTLAHEAEEYIRHIWFRGWQLVNFQFLPTWLKDNELLLHGHRPQLHTTWACFKSILRIHTETANIWTHLLGSFAFLIILVYFVSQPAQHIQWQDKLVFLAFFIGAVCCLGLSCLFHTLLCHSQSVALIMSKLDYTGISFLTMGSFVPYLYYSFYCIFWAKLFYLILISVLGISAIIVSMADKFAAVKYRPLRAAVFLSLGLSGLIPCIHVIVINGFWDSVNNKSVGWLFLMAMFYIVGASIYTARVPERFAPGMFDIWFHSHQIFHVFVVIAACIHYHGLVKLADYSLTSGDCRPEFGKLFETETAIPVELTRYPKDL